MAELSVEEIEGLYKRCGASVLHRCRQLLRNEAASWDAMHQTFVRALRYRKSYQGTSEPLGWLFAIATRVCMDEIRTRGRLGSPITGEIEATTGDGEIPETMEARVHQKRTVAGLLANFNVKVQEVVVMRYFDELEVKEISQRTGLSERTVARRLSEFLERSRRILEGARS